MWNAFSKLAQNNLDHYNNHPVQHAIILGAATVVAVVGSGKIVDRLLQEPPHPGVPPVKI